MEFSTGYENGMADAEKIARSAAAMPFCVKRSCVSDFQLSESGSQPDMAIMNSEKLSQSLFINS